MSETVKIRVEIEISMAGDADTGVSLDEWNAMSDEERSALVGQIWLDEAGGHDNGGVWTLTEGATGV